MDISDLNEGAVEQPVADSAINATTNPDPAPEPETAPAATPAATPAEVPAALAADAPVATETVIEAVTEPKADDEPAEETARLDSLSREELYQRLAAIAALPAAEISREGVAKIKQLYYNQHNIHLVELRDQWVAEGNDPEAFAIPDDELEAGVRQLLAEIKEKKNALLAAQEVERQANLEKKKAIIDQLNEMSADTDNVNRHFPRVKELQQEFKGIGEVPPTEQSDVWKRYQEAVERFYDQLKINKDLRDYDFRKNLDTKQLLCQQAEELVGEDDVVVAFKRLQELHDKWRETGPVAKEMREDIWTRFKDASAAINKRYQAYFEERKARERENELAKTALCERIEALDFSNLHSYLAWDAMTQEILKAQNEWKQLGFASRKLNNELFNRFRASCDKFFTAKAEYFKTMKEELSQNLAKKTALCERAEALKDSTDWRATTDALVELQKEWKTIGTVAKKYSDAIWHRFQEACDYFFEQKKKATSGARQTEQANLKAKKEVIAKLREIDPETTDRAEAVKQVRELQQQWQSIGHVPFREKDKVYDAYRELTNKLFRALDMRQSRDSMERFENSLNEMAGDEIKMLRERERMLRAYEQRKSELKTYENNLGFFNSKSKSGDSMVREMERKMERNREDLKVLEEKIKVIDKKI